MSDAPIDVDVATALLVAAALLSDATELLLVDTMQLGTRCSRSM